MTSGTGGAIGKRAQVILVWVRAPGHGNAFHPQELGITRVRPRALDGSWCPDSEDTNPSLDGSLECFMKDGARMKTPPLHWMAHWSAVVRDNIVQGVMPRSPNLWRGITQ